MFAVGVPTLWNMLHSSVKSVENIAKFRHHLKTYLQPCLSTIELPNVSINLMTTGIVY